MLRYTLFRIFIFICFLFLGVLVSLGFDSHYNNVKRNYIFDNSELYIIYDKQELTTLAQRYLRFGKIHGAEALEQLEKKFRERVDGTSIIVDMELRDAEGRSVLRVTNEEKLREYNRFPNAFILSGFSRSLKGDVNYRDSEGVDKRGEIIVNFTTPQKNLYIQNLTKRYALYALLSFLFILIGYLLLDRFFLRPYGAVVRSIGDHAEQPPIVRPANSRLEKSYNDLARETLIRLIERHFLGSEQNQRYETTSQALHELPDLALPLLGYSWILIISRRITARDEPPFCYWALTPATEVKSEKGTNSSAVNAAEETERPPSGIGLPVYQGESLLQQKGLDEIDRLCGEGKPQKNVTSYLLSSKALVPQACLVSKLQDVDEPEMTHYLFAGAPPNVYLDEDHWETATFQLLCERMREILQRLAQQRDVLASERRMANVALARNLGHDLTNVIATSKLDLMTLKRLADKEETISGKKLTILRGSLDNLFNNTRFMQAIVDLYRSFSYLQRPSYSYEDIAELLRETTEIFTISSSFDFELELKLPEGLPHIMAEARLLKLAVFNLLNNSLDALKHENRREEKKSPQDKSPADTDPTGSLSSSVLKLRPEKARIRVKAKLAPNPADGVILTVEDNGPGICDGEGVRLTQEELPHIFELGYTTKSEGEGEGLGLNWVRTIITDFHGGRIRAENLAPRGARFEVSLPLRPPEEMLHTNTTANQTGES